MSVYARERELSRARVSSILCINVAAVVPPDVCILTKPLAVVQGCGLIEAAPLTPSPLDMSEPSCHGASLTPGASTGKEGGSRQTEPACAVRGRGVG